jgi:Ice-binding-like
MKRFKSLNTTFALSTTVLITAILAGCGGDGSTSALLTPPTAPAGSSAGSTATTASTGTTCSGTSCANIGTAANYVILAKAAVSTSPMSVITGNVGVSPAAATYLTGWTLITESSNTFDTSAQVTAPSKLYAADMTGGTTSSDIGTAVLDMETAYTAAAGKAPAGGGLITACPGAANGTSGAMSDINDGAALVAGVYTCAVNVTIPGNLTLTGNATDVWVFQITGTLTQASATQVILTGGALSKNVFWQVSGAVTVGTTAVMEGVILAQTNVAVQTGATVNGRLLAQTAVTLDTATVTAP